VKPPRANPAHQRDALRIGPAAAGWSFLSSILRRVVAHPDADCDTLLIVADALRTDAATYPAAAPTLRAYADILTDIAPTRALPAKGEG
jgi:hypothetical protein